MRVRLGDKVEEGQSLATLMEGGLSRTEEAKKLLLAAIEIGSEPVEKPELVYGVSE